MCPGSKKNRYHHKPLAPGQWETISPRREGGRERETRGGLVSTDRPQGPALGHSHSHTPLYCPPVPSGVRFLLCEPGVLIRCALVLAR